MRTTLAPYFVYILSEKVVLAHTLPLRRTVIIVVLVSYQVYMYVKRAILVS